MRRRSLLLVSLAGLLVAGGLAARKHFPQNRGRDREAASMAVASSLPELAPVDGDRALVIHRAERVLGLYLDGRLTATYPVALGPDAEGQKEREGDRRTPEGLYYICTRNPRSRFHLFLGLSYPNASDADAGLRAGRISRTAHRRIVEAIEAQRQPPWDTPLGGEMGIHGGGTASDWTLGCIALENQAIEHLWDAMRLGDPVLICP